MIKSMTGFGKTELELGNKKVIIEIKTLNSKQIDINTRMPSAIRTKELEIRSLLSAKLERGKIDFSINFEQTGESIDYTFNKEMAKKYYEEIRSLASEINQTEFSNYLPIVLKMPDVLKPSKEDLDKDSWERIEKSIVDALIQVDEFRTQEGAHLQEDIVSRINGITGLLDEVEPFENERINQIKTRIHKKLKEMQQDLKIDQNRFEQELIYYLEKIDITEEKVRLNKHCDYFLESLEIEGSLGKKLNFISQEIGREINTLGSKANDVSIQKIVIQMKDELEKIKEQLFNIL
ncbi:MAG: YicC family protein [Bacteroidetes bacterium]|nr:YicC family protein [Bacteroidota bacterium]